MAVHIQIRRGASTDWAEVNPTLSEGEMGYENDTLKFKVGDGVADWNSLPYINVLPGLLGVANGIATLDSNSKLYPSQIPDIAKVTVHAVADSSARLALTVEPGDIAIQADTGGTYVLASSPASTDGNWSLITVSDPFPTHTTDNLTEGSTNLYFTNSRAQSAVASDIATAISNAALGSTDDLPEGTTNLYFTNQRAIDAVGGSATSSNTPNSVVKRDGSGNFSAGTITANLTGNVSGNAGTVTNGVYTTDTGTVTSTMIANGTIVDADINSAAAIAKTKISGTAITAADTSTVTNAMLAGSITNAKLVNSKVTVGTTDISLGASATTIAGLSSVTSTTFTGNLTGNVTGTVSSLSNHTTDDLTEGSTNQYFTDNRAKDSAVSAITAGTGVTKTPGTHSASFSIGQAVGTTDNVTFNDVTVSGNLDVKGTVTTIESTTLTVADKNIELAKGSNTDSAANGGGITLHGLTDKTLNWVSGTSSWTSSENVDLASGKTYKINGTDVLTSSQVLGKSVPSGTIVGTSDAQTLSSKTISGASNTLTNIGNGSLTNSKVTIGTTDISLGATVTDLADVTINSTTIPSSKTLVTTSDTGSVTSTMIADGTIVNADINASAAIADTKLATISTAGKVSNSATTATSSNTNGAIVARNGSGDFSAGTITANLTGQVSDLSNHTTTDLTEGTNLYFTNERAQDAVFNAVANGSGISTTYDDAGNSFTIAVDSTIVTKTDVQTLTNKTLTSPTITSPSGLVKADVGLGNVNNTSDASKPISTATQTALDGKLSLSGGTMTGYLILNADPSNALGAVTKQYADAIASGMNTHPAVLVATTANLSTSYSNGTLGVGATLQFNANGAQTIDNVTLQANDRVLVKNQTTQTENGIYYVTTAGNGGQKCVLTRATDANNNIAGQVEAGDLVYVVAPSSRYSVTPTNNNTSWTQYNVGTGTNNYIVIGTDNILWSQSSGVGVMTAGTGISLSGNQINIDSTVATLTGTQTLDNKTLTTPHIASILNNSGTLTLPTSTDTLVGRATTDVLTNKSISGSSNTLTNIPNSALTNSTISGVSLGSNLNALTIGTGLSGTSYNGSTGVTIAIDSTVATLAGIQTLTNKTISGASNTLTNIGNSSLTNSSVTINGTSFALGDSKTIKASTTNALTIGTGLSGTSFDGGTAVTIAIDSTVATLTGSQTLTNKTLTTPIISSISNTGTLTLPTSTDTLVGKATTDTFTNKTFDTAGTGNSFKINGTSITAVTGTGSVALSASPTFTGTVNAAAVTTSGDVTVGGNLTVQGTTTTVNSTTLAVTDKNIEIGNVASPTDTTANGGGLTLHGTTDKTLNWVSSTPAWTSSENFDLASGKTYKIAGTDVLTATQVLGKSVPSGTIVGTSDSQTLSSKTLTLPTIGGTGANFSGSTSGTINLLATATAGTNTITLPATTGTVVTTGDTGTVTSTMILDGTILNADINASAAIAATKISGTAVTQADTGTVTNTMLAGSIANAKLLNSSVTIGSTSVSLGGTAATVSGLTLSSATATGGITHNGSTSGSTVLQASATASGTLTLPAATDTLVGKATTDTLTNKTFDTAGTGNVFKINGTQISANTGSGSNVLATSPTLVTPTLGVASATSVNKVAITAPATSATLTLADGSTLATSGAYSTTLTATGATTLTLPTSGTLISGASFAAKGDVLIGTGSGTFTNLGVGTNGTVLTADSTQTSGVKWAAVTGESFSPFMLMGA